jgi:hypothetical protein
MNNYKLTIRNRIDDNFYTREVCNQFEAELELLLNSCGVDYQTCFDFYDCMLFKVSDAKMTQLTLMGLFNHYKLDT